jgi:hypothetical protein
MWSGTVMWSWSLETAVDAFERGSDNVDSMIIGSGRASRSRCMAKMLWNGLLLWWSRGGRFERDRELALICSYCEAACRSLACAMSHGSGSGSADQACLVKKLVMR